MKPEELNAIEARWHPLIDSWSSCCTYRSAATGHRCTLDAGHPSAHICDAARMDHDPVADLAALIAEVRRLGIALRSAREEAEFTYALAVRASGPIPTETLKPGDTMPGPMALVCRLLAALMEGHPNAANYLGWKWTDGATDKAYNCVVTRSEGETPQDKAARLEGERDTYRAALVRIARHVASPGAEDMADNLAVGDLDVLVEVVSGEYGRGHVAGADVRMARCKEDIARRVGVDERHPVSWEDLCERVAEMHTHEASLHKHADRAVKGGRRIVNEYMHVRTDIIGEPVCRCGRRGPWAADERCPAAMAETVEGE